MEKALRKKRKSRTKELVFGAFALGIIALTIVSLSIGLLDPFERRLLDFRFQTVNPGVPASPEIVYIDIDDVSLETLSDQIGGWPWPRGLVVADLILNYAMIGGPSSFLFDVIYSEYSPKLPSEPISDQDLWMAEVSALYPEVSHAVLFTEQSFDARQEMFASAANVFEIDVDDSESTLELPNYDYFLAPYSPLVDVANALHAVNHLEDDDGISRRNQLFVQYDGKYYPGLALRGVMDHLGLTDVVIDGHTMILSGEGADTLEVPLTADGNYQINFPEDLDAFEAYPADNVIASAQEFYNGNEDVSVPPEVFTDKIVVLGASALGLKDVKVTPLGKTTAGPYLHILAMSNLMQSQHLFEIPVAWNVAIVAIITMLILAATFYLPNGTVRAVLGAVGILVWFAVALLMFQYAGWIFDMATTIVALVLAYLGGLVFTSLSEAAEKNKISSAMGKYLAPAVMSEVLDNYEELVGEVGESRELAILFSDIRSFSSISEKYPAETVVAVLNRYLERMIAVVFDNRGTMDKMIGDAIMAFWGAPNPQGDKEKLAVDTALEMIRRLDALNPELAEDGLPELKIGVGVHTGEMIVGNIGSEQRLDYTAIGDNVNLGSRLEGLTKYYKAPILVSETTYEPLKDEMEFVFLDSVAVKGKTQGIGIYTPVDRYAPDSDSLDEAIAQFARGREQYASGDFVGGLKTLNALGKESSQLAGPAQVFAARCDRFRKEPPPENWGGVWTMTEK